MREVVLNAKRTRSNKYAEGGGTTIKNLVALVDDEDYAEVAKYSWVAARRSDGRPQYTWYAIRTIRKEDGRYSTQSLHRFLMRNPSGIVDHIDGNGLNNTRSNLRVVTHAQSLANKHHTRAKSGYLGVYWSAARGQWRVNPMINGKKIQVGYFDNVEDAARARDEYMTSVHGEYASMNFPAARGV